MASPRIDTDGAPVRAIRRTGLAGPLVVAPASSYLSRPCPRCGAPAGHACRKLRGRGFNATVARSTPHDERRRHRLPSGTRIGSAPDR